MTQLNEIKNKIKRQEVYHKNKQLKKKVKKTKTGEIPKTTENMREEGDEDMVTELRVSRTRSDDLLETLSNETDDGKSVEDDQESGSEEGSEEQEQESIGANAQPETVDTNETTEDINQDHFSSKSPKKILVTTSKRPTPNGYKFTTEFTKIFPNAEFIKRQSQFSIQKICELASQRDYTTVMVVNEDHKQPNKVTIINLPYGPTAHFNLSSIKLHKDILNHAKLGVHKPELVLNGFSTRLGQTVGRNGEKCDIQEIGPRFTLKLEFLQKGVYDMKFGEYEWKHKPELDTSRQKFHL